MSIYTDNGFVDRKAYIKSLSENYGVGLDVIWVMAQILGPIEDFDGLISTIEDYQDGGWS